jgi:hypothetical protein
VAGIRQVSKHPYPPLSQYIQAVGLVIRASLDRQHLVFCATRAQLNTSTHDPFIKKLVDVFRIENCSPRNPKTFYLFVGLFYICTLERPKRRIWGLEI